MHIMKRKYTILIVDDQMLNIMFLTNILEAEYEILYAKDGRSAIEAALTIKPDLILLDVIMPDMDGYDVLVTLKSYDATKDIPVIYITGLTRTESEEKGLALGAVDYITKPFQNSVVKARIRTHLRIVSYVRTIERLCMIDALTDLPNRRGFDKRIEAEWERAILEKLPISVLMLDIDNFKTYNDAYGHLQGDIMLQAIANTISRTLKRDSDFAARWGGEEFIALLPETDIDGAMLVAEQIREKVEQMLVPYADNTSTSATISIGVNSKTPSRGDTILSFISDVDKALYAAKSSGRNHVCSYV